MLHVLASARAEEIVAQAQKVQADLIQETIAIAQIPAPTFAEAARAEYVVHRMRHYGVTAAEVDEAGNVIGCIPGTGTRNRRALLLTAHLDTVFPIHTDVAVTIDGDIMRGPGVGDNAASVATMLQAIRLLVQNRWQLSADVIFAATVGEEGLGNLRGMRALIDRLGEGLGYVLPIDGTLGGLVHQAVGSLRYQLIVNAEGGHSWGAFGRPSAIHSISKMITRISEINIPAQPKTTFNVGLISGGTAVNAIAARAEAVIDLRSVDPAALARLDRRVRNIISQVADQSAVSAALELVGERPAGAIAPDHPLCRAIRSVHRRLGLTTRVYPSSTDGNISLARNIPTVTIGVTFGGNGHRLDEFIETPPLTTGLAQVLLAILAVQELTAG